MRQAAAAIPLRHLVSSFAFVGFLFWTTATAATAQQPGQPFAQVELPAAMTEALRLANNGDLAGAIAVVESLCAEADAPEAARALLGALHVEAGNAEEAARVLAPLAAVSNADPGVLYNAGRAAEALGQLGEAGDFYRRSLTAEPRSPAQRSLGMLLGRVGRPADAYAFLQPWTRANPGDTEARLAAAAGAIALERTPEAEALLEGLDANDAGVKMLRAQVLLQKADPWGAVGQLQELAEEPPPDLEGGIRRTLARAWLVVGEAEGALEQMARVQTAGAEDAVLLANAFFQAGRMEEAIDALAPWAEPLLQNPPPEAPPPVARDVVLEYGRYLQSSGEAARAVPFLRLATELAPRKADAFQALGQALAANGERDLAREALARFQDLSSDAANEVASVDQRRRDIADPTGREVRRALEIAARGETDAALAILARESQLGNADPRPAWAASSILLDAGRNEEALAAADQAMEAAPAHADSFYQRGAVLMSLERLAEAEEMFRQALGVQSEHPATLSDFAVLLMTAGRDDEARAMLGRLLAARPHDPLARQLLESMEGSRERTSDVGPTDNARFGRERMNERDFQAAEEPLQRAVSAEPANGPLRLDFAATLWENGKPEEAEKQAREAAALMPSSASAHRLLGGLLLWRGAHLEAAEPLQRAASLTAPDAELLVELGNAWAGAAQASASTPTEAMCGEEPCLERAEATFRDALALAQDHSEATYGLARVLQRLGRDTEAAAVMQRYERSLKSGSR